MPKVPYAELLIREYWTPEQAATVLGHGASYWRKWFDAEKGRGYTSPPEPIPGRRTYRYLVAQKAREHLTGKVPPAPIHVVKTDKQRYQEALHRMLNESPSPCST